MKTIQSYSGDSHFDIHPLPHIPILILPPNVLD